MIGRLQRVFVPARKLEYFPTARWLGEVIIPQLWPEPREIAGYVTKPSGAREVLFVDSHDPRPRFVARELGPHLVELVPPRRGLEFVPGFSAVDSAKMTKAAIEVELVRIGRNR